MSLGAASAAAGVKSSPGSAWPDRNNIINNNINSTNCEYTMSLAVCSTLLFFVTA